MSCVARGLGHIVSKEIKKLFKCITKVIKKRDSVYVRLNSHCKAWSYKKKKHKKIKSYRKSIWSIHITATTTTNAI